MIITKIERQKRNPNRVNIYIEGEFAFGINEEVLLKFKLKKGDDLDSETIKEIQSKEEFKLAKEKAIKLIGLRNRSEKEIRSGLKEKEFSPKAIEEAIEYLQRIKLIDDNAFARSYVKDILLRKPAGKQYLIQMLRLKGIKKEIINDVLRETFQEAEEEKLAEQATIKLLKRYRTSRKEIGKEKQQKRIISYLSRRGFSWDIISSVNRKLFKEKTFIICHE